MQPCPRLLHARFRRALLLLAVGFPFTALVVSGARAAADGAGVLSGTVSNAATGNLLEGARVTIPPLGRTVLTDQTGRFVFSNLPSGSFDVVASYEGLDEQRSTVQITAGQSAMCSFDLTSGLYVLGEFRVTGEREGNAAAITSQRNAENVKNVVALDAYGNLPNMSAGELAIRLPGVAGGLDEEGNVTGVIIRGAGPGLNRINIDGNLVSNVGGFNRQFQTHSLTGAMFEQLEVVKGHTPDQTADSLGGSVNLKTRSPLSIREKRRINYSFGARWAAPFFEQGPLREDHPIHPQINFAYQEVFDVFGGGRNLGIAANLFYSENVNSPATTVYDYEFTTNAPAYIWDYREMNYYNNRRQNSLNLKAEYRLSDTTTLRFNGIYNDAKEAFDRRFNFRAFSNRSVAAIGPDGQPTGTGAIVRGYTEDFTEVRPVNGSNFELSSTFNSFFNRTRLVNLGAEHKLAQWDIDYDGSYSQTHNNLGTGDKGPGGSLVARVPNVGWTLDTTDPENPVFIQTAGASIHDIASYRNNVQLVRRDNARDIEIFNAKGNALYRAEASFPLTFKTGAFYRWHKVAEVNGQRRWNRVGTAPALTPISTATTWWEDRTGRDLPYIETSGLIDQLGDPTLWTEDIYYRESQKRSATRNATEEVTAGYVQAQAKFGRLGVLGGIRTERTEVEGFGYVRVRPAPASQIPDPAERAAHDWDNPARNSGRYTKSFPSIHFTYDISADLKARASWSTSFGRPSFASLVPTAAINDNAQTVTVGNPALLPQYSENIDLSLEYYFRPAGLVSVGVFRKDIEDYITTGEVGIVGSGSDNGFDGDYAGYTLRSQANIGSAKIEGIEFDYRQQFTFLPGFLRRFAASANYTYLKTEGDYGSGTPRSTSQVAGFVPRTANASLSYTQGPLGLRLLVNYTGKYLANFSTNAARLRDRGARTIVNLGASYQLRPQMSLFVDVSNLLDEKQEFYRYRESQVERVIRNNPALTFGISGRF